MFRILYDSSSGSVERLAILELYRTNLTFLSILQSKNHVAKHRLRTQKYHK